MKNPQQNGIRNIWAFDEPLNRATFTWAVKQTIRTFWTSSVELLYLARPSQAARPVERVFKTFCLLMLLHASIEHTFMWALPHSKYNPRLLWCTTLTFFIAPSPWYAKDPLVFLTTPYALVWAIKPTPSLKIDLTLTLTLYYWYITSHSWLEFIKYAT